MRLLLAVALLALGGAGYVYWTQQNALVPMAESEQALSRYDKFARCAALHGQLDDEMKQQGKSTFERLANMALVEVFVFAAKADQTRGDRSDATITGEINRLKAKYAGPAASHVKGKTGGVVSKDLAHCSDLKAVLK